MGEEIIKVLEYLKSSDIVKGFAIGYVITFIIIFALVITIFVITFKSIIKSQKEMNNIFIKKGSEK